MIAAAIPWARLTASALLVGFSFQFPVMKAFRANNSVECLPAVDCWGTKALAAPRDNSERAAESFILLLFVWLNSCRMTQNVCVSLSPKTFRTEKCEGLLNDVQTSRLFSGRKKRRKVSLWGTDS